jgi:holo-[acyl-carrier protein] synthase
VRALTGVDLVDVGRIERLLDEYGPRFVGRVFREEETRYCESRHRPALHFAARFAAKEAVLKALGTGFGLGGELRDVEVVREESGSVSTRLHGKAKSRADSLGVTSIALSISHTDAMAIAQVVAIVP